MANNQATQTNEKPTPEEQALKFEKYKYKVEIVKWFIASVALVVVTIVIDKGFKERAAGIQEMQAYDKYVDVILKADNIEDRWKLSQYFSTVTPTGRLRERWIAYKDSLNDDYKIFKQLKAKEFELNKQTHTSLIIDDTTAKIEKELIKVQNQLAPFQKSLISAMPVITAKEWEEKGFSYLFNRDVVNAIDVFRNSENQSSQFHQVYEIANYLNENKEKLADPHADFWKTAFKKIATDYSWKMPSETKKRLIENSK